MRANILVVDDDEALSEMIGIVLRNDGFEPTFCATGDLALEAFRASDPDLVLLDLMLPGKDGIEVCREIREEADTPIVMLTAKSDTADVVRGLEAGADDYVPKPFKPAELVARVRARLRTPEPSGRPDGETLTIGDLTIDVAGHEVRRGNTRISLTPSNSTCSPHWQRSPGKSGTGRCCSRRCGGIATRRTPGWSTFMSSACDPKWRRTRRTQRSSRLCVALVIRPAAEERRGYH